MVELADSLAQDNVYMECAPITWKKHKTVNLLNVEVANNNRTIKCGVIGVIGINVLKHVAEDGNIGGEAANKEEAVKVQITKKKSVILSTVQFPNFLI